MDANTTIEVAAEKIVIEFEESLVADGKSSKTENTRVAVTWEKIVKELTVQVIALDSKNRICKGNSDLENKMTGLKINTMSIIVG
ncbi:MAG: hypothetical protein ABF633_06750 [Clostridium sp.]|uniref:hypothetical protein n=1 Tax=Clostridium sp. TaxID=1506 RepID=UPI0039E748EF